MLCHAPRKPGGVEAEDALLPCVLVAPTQLEKGCLALGDLSVGGVVVDALRKLLQLHVVRRRQLVRLAFFDASVDLCQWTVDNKNCFF